MRATPTLVAVYLCPVPNCEESHPLVARIGNLPVVRCEHLDGPELRVFNDGRVLVIGAAD